MQSILKFTHHINRYFILDPILLHPHPVIDSKSTTVMASQPANLADPALLEKINKFFELGIGEYVALPQVSSASL